jgi:hypothetical protein
MNRKAGKREGHGIEALISSRLPAFLFILLSTAGLAGCVTVAPQERAVLADPTMQFDGDKAHEAPLRHAIDNREGSMGGTGVSGGGCGCN